MNMHRRKEGEAFPEGGGVEGGGVDVLDVSPFGGDLDAGLQPKPRRAKPPGPTMWLGVAVVLAIGFLGGVQAHKTWGKSSGSSGFPSGAAALGQRGSSSSSSSQPGGMPGGMPGAMGGGAPGSSSGTSGASGTVGTIKSVKGNTIYIQTSNGVVKVTTSSSTKVTVSKTGKAADLKPGASVTVQGSTGSDGSVTAQTLTQR